VNVLDLSADPEISHALETLATHNAVQLVRADGVPADGTLLVVVNMDAYDSAPPSLTQRLARTAAGRVHFIAWSVEQGFEKIATCGWSAEELAGSIVAWPPCSAMMLETILCKILSITLSSPDHECVLTAGGRFRVDHTALQATAVKRKVQGGKTTRPAKRESTLAEATLVQSTIFAKSSKAIKGMLGKAVTADRVTKELQASHAPGDRSRTVSAQLDA
jgi:hypothetical protein